MEGKQKTVRAISFVQVSQLLLLVLLVLVSFVSSQNTTATPSRSSTPVSVSPVNSSPSNSPSKVTPSLSSSPTGVRNCSGTSCEDCIASGPNCGLCLSNLGGSFCATGTSSGPIGATCYSTEADTYWYFGTCPDYCTESYSSCGECTAAGCGYCTTSRGAECVTSSRVGHSINCTQYIAPGAQCVFITQCSQAFDCQSCTGATSVNGGCVWCGQSGGSFATGSCLPTVNNATCSDPYSIYRAGMACPAPPSSATSAYQNNFISAYVKPEWF